MADDPAQKPPSSEPSMEDILASIRRILAEDTAQEAEKATPSQPLSSNLFDDLEMNAPSPPAEPADVEIAELREAAENPEPPPADVFVLTPAMRASPPAASESSLAAPATEAPPPAAAADRRVVSPPAAEVSADVLSQLAKAILDRRDIAISSRDVTLEGMVREMLRPLLREWLDRNLPYLIERLVKKEIDLMVNRAERLDD